MKPTIRFFILSLLISNLTFSQDWVRTDITPFSSLDFPVESVSQEINGELLYTAKDNNGIYMLSVMRFDNRINSILTEDQIPDYYKGMVDGIVKATNATLVSKKDIIIKGVRGIEIEYIAASNPELPSQRFTQILYTNPYLFKIIFLPYADKSDNAGEIKAKFFNSFTLNTDEIKKLQSVESKETSENIASKMGRYAGETTAFLVFIGLIIALILFLRFLIRKLIKKKPILNNNIEQQTQNVTITCYNCQTENRATSKYCKQCGYELSKSHKD